MAYCAYCGSHVAQASFAPCASCGKPTNGAPPPPVRQSSTAAIVAGVVVGAFVVIAIIGVLAAIAIPNLLTATERARQKRTMADMRTMATAIEAYRMDKGVYPRAESVTDLDGALVPTYARQLPHKDGWGGDFVVHATEQGYFIGSAGKDLRLERAPEEYTRTETRNFDCDIVFANGAFVQYPEGIAGGGQ